MRILKEIYTLYDITNYSERMRKDEIETENPKKLLVAVIFTARRIASAVLATAIPSVRLSVHPSHVGIVSKRRHVAQCSLHCPIAKRV